MVVAIGGVLCVLVMAVLSYLVGRSAPRADGHAGDPGRTDDPA